MNLKNDIIYGTSCHVLDDVKNQMCCSRQYDIQANTIYSQYYHICILLGFEVITFRDFFLPKVCVVHAVFVQTSEAA
jgi:hypothetical protein